MSWLELGKKIAEIGSPILGLAVGGVPGALIGKELAKLFGANEEDPSDILDKIMQDPDAKIKLASIESERTIELGKINYDLVKARLDHLDHHDDVDIKDVEDARQMMIVTHGFMPKLLTIMITLSLMIFTASLFVNPIPKDNNQLIMGILVLIGYQFWNACRFWLGGSVPTIKTIKDFLRRK